MFPFRESQRSIVVLESDERFATGLLNAQGEPIFKWRVKPPAGFVDFERERMTRAFKQGQIQEGEQCSS